MSSNANRPLNVAMFAPWHERCGIHDYAAHLVSAMDTLPDIDSVRIVSAPPNAARAGFAAAVSHRRGDAEQFRRLGRAMNAATDVAHVQHQYFLFGGVAPYRSHITSFLNAIRIPTVMTVHEIADEAGGWLSRAAVHAANQANFAHPVIKALIVHTEPDRANLIRIGLPGERIHVIRHPVPPARPMPDPPVARRALEAVFPAVAGRRVITLFGFLSNKKGHRIALAALAQLPDDVALVFAGDQHPDDHTPYVSSLRADIERLDLSGRVVITGYLSEEKIAEIMSITDIAVAPYLRTSGSGSLANLFAYGRAVIASDIEPHRELLAAEPGLLALVPTRNPASLATEIAAVLANATCREGLQRAALEFAARNPYAQFAAQTVRVYREALGT